MDGEARGQLVVQEPASTGGKRRVVLPADEFEGLLRIVANPEAPTAAARESFAKYRRMRDESERGRP